VRTATTQLLNARASRNHALGLRRNPSDHALPCLAATRGSTTEIVKYEALSKDLVETRVNPPHPGIALPPKSCD